MASTKKSEKSDKGVKATMRQVGQLYRYTVKEDKYLPLWLTLGFVVTVVVGVLFCFIVHANVAFWILLMLMFVMLALLVDTIILTRDADRVAYKRMDGTPGASSAVLSSINKGGFTFPQEPVWMDKRTHAMIWRGTGRTGIYLVGEGDRAMLEQEMNREEHAIRRAVPGSDIPIYRIFVGNGKNQVPLSKLRNTVIRHKVVMTKVELDQLNGRLTSLQGKQMRVPRGVDPRRMKVNSRMMRRHTN
jgi:F0F1-type ATP synthase assembly protein I